MYSVYKIECNNNFYIGQTNNFKRRVWEHKDSLKKNKHCNKYLQQAYNIFGDSSFNFEELIQCNTREEAKKFETYYINYYGGIESSCVYNFQDNITENKEMRFLVSNNQKGKYISKVQREAVSKARLGSKDSYETRLKKSKARIGDLNPNYGNRKYSKEFIQLLRNEYKIYNNYAALSRKYNITPCSISNLIKYGTTINPNLKNYLYKEE